MNETVLVVKDLSFGQYSLPVILTTFTMFLFRYWEVSDRKKPLITVLFGIALGFLWIFYTGTICTVPTVVDSLFYGALQGFAAIGIYEMQDKARSPTTMERKKEKEIKKDEVKEAIGEIKQEKEIEKIVNEIKQEKEINKAIDKILKDPISKGDM